MEDEMRKRIPALILALVLLAACCPAAFATDSHAQVDYWDGSIDTSWYYGNMSNYTIRTGAQLAGLAQLVKSGRATFEGKTIRLAADIYLNEFLLDSTGALTSGKHHEWTPIGCYDGGWQPFCGDFDGQGHIISGVMVNYISNYPKDKNVGLFGYTYGASIKNITVTDSWVRGADFAGGVVGNAYDSQIENCSFSGSVTGPLRVGSILGAAYMGSRAYNCLGTGVLTADRYVGGIAGYMAADTSLENCWSLCTVTVNEENADQYGGNTPHGGLVGVAEEGAETRSCGYLQGTEVTPAGTGQLAGAVFTWESFSNGDILYKLNDGTYGRSDLLTWMEIRGYPTLNGDASTVAYPMLPPAELRGEVGYIYTRNFSDDIGVYVGFLDVDETDWYGLRGGDGSLAMAVQLGIITGYADETFGPNNSLRISEAIKMAVTVYDIYNYGQVLDFDMTGPIWYEEVVEHAISEGLIREDDFEDYTAYATRAQMAYIFAAALPQSELTPINDITSLPDVDGDTPYCDEIFMLYRAGIFTGNDIYGRFDPDSTITRVQAAAIISRLAVVSFRKNVTF